MFVKTMVPARRFASKIKSEFVVGVKNGYLPIHDPLVELPKEFSALEELLQMMPMTRSDGNRGLLADGLLGRASERVPEHDVDRVQDGRLLAALFRDYTFWASAYLLEPCHLNMLRTGSYGSGRDKLPRNIAVPLSKISERLSMKPFMEYATSYALYNWRRNDEKKGIEYGNLSLIRAFTGMPSEAGFILVHVAMVADTKHQVRAVKKTLEALAEARKGDSGEQGGKGEKKSPRERFNEGLEEHLLVMKKINATMETMWSRSDPNDYKEFRTFIMGIKNQPMFPTGVIYEGVAKEAKSFRGESGANDSIIPTADNLFQLFEQMPPNPLTEILKDFRTYRPERHTHWLGWVEQNARALRLREYATEATKSALLMLQNLDQIREFRQRHWSFTKEYILKHSDHPVATGGSPIATWLPNQLSAVLKEMKRVIDSLTGQVEDEADRDILKEIVGKCASQESILEREVEAFSRQIKSGTY